MEQLRLALVGCGGMAEAHVGGLKELREAGVDDIEVVACCDRVEEAAQQRAAEIAGFQDHEPAIHTDVDEMLVRVDGLDAVDICAPHSQHHLLAGAGLRQAGDLRQRGLHRLGDRALDPWGGEHAHRIAGGGIPAEPVARGGRTALPRRRGGLCRNGAEGVRRRGPGPGGAGGGWSGRLPLAGDLHGGARFKRPVTLAEVEAGELEATRPRSTRPWAFARRAPRTRAPGSA